MITASLRRLAPKAIVATPDPTAEEVAQVRSLFSQMAPLADGSTIVLCEAGRSGSFTSATGDKSGDAELADALERALGRGRAAMAELTVSQ